MHHFCKCDTILTSYFNNRTRNSLRPANKNMLKLIRLQYKSGCDEHTYISQKKSGSVCVEQQNL